MCVKMYSYPVFEHTFLKSDPPVLVFTQLDYQTTIVLMHIGCALDKRTLYFDIIIETLLWLLMEDNITIPMNSLYIPNKIRMRRYRASRDRDEWSV